MPYEAKRMVVFSIREQKQGPSTWNRIGSAWENRDGSINVYLDSLPLDGKLHLRAADDAKSIEVSTESSQG